jgi:hydrogenase expression/formation protein HypD
VRVMYSPSDALRWAALEPGRTFAVAAVGFETTLPAYALLLERMAAENVRNVRLLTALKAMMPALAWICENEPAVNGLLGPGHVSVITGGDAYAPLCARYRIPLAVSGFTYEQILGAIADLLSQIKNGLYQAHNLYPRAVACEGNLRAQELIGRYFTLCDAQWRGMGKIASSGYELRPEFTRFSAGPWYAVDGPEGNENCLCGRVIMGRAEPGDCPNFGALCTPGTPLGPCMVSAEGACGIWYANGRGASA